MVKLGAIDYLTTKLGGGGYNGKEPKNLTFNWHLQKFVTLMELSDTSP